MERTPRILTMSDEEFWRRHREEKRAKRLRQRFERMTVADFNASLPRTQQPGEPRAGVPRPAPTGQGPPEGASNGGTP